jgi:enhancer of polycomb-like protein
VIIIIVMTSNLTTATSKQLSFRAKKLDFSKPLPVYHCDELTEFGEYAQVSRTMPTIATGVEKEEEEEHHLQAAISASNVPGKTTPLYIPTPDASKEVENYDKLYRNDFKMPKGMIRETEILGHILLVNYDMDEDDEMTLRNYNTKSTRNLTEEQFELFIDQLEKLTRAKGDHELATLQDIEGVLKSGGLYADAGQTLYTYWCEKKKKLKGGNIVPTIRVSFHVENRDSLDL